LQPHRSRLLPAALLTAAIGLAVSLDLVWLHYKVHTDSSYRSFCAMSDAFNCETVAESRYAVFLGLPVAVWGALGYALLAVILAAMLRRGRSPLKVTAGLALSAASVLISAVLAVISYCVICSFCLLCSLTYAVNLALLAFFVRETFALRPKLAAARAELLQLVKKSWPVFAACVLLVIALMIAYPKYWQHKIAPESSLRQGVTADGSHWLGAAEPGLTIIEYSDYRCPHCQRGHAAMRELLALNPDKLRVVHRHFPLDNACNSLLDAPFHVGACLLAEAAQCAGAQGRFWEMNDLLYQADQLSGASWEERVRAAARTLGLDPERFRQCLDSKEGSGAVKRDIAEGLKLGISGTPAFLVDGRVYSGKVPDQVLTRAGLRVSRDGK